MAGTCKAGGMHACMHACMHGELNLRFRTHTSHDSMRRVFKQKQGDETSLECWFNWIFVPPPIGCAEGLHEPDKRKASHQVLSYLQ